MVNLGVYPVPMTKTFGSAATARMLYKHFDGEYNETKRSPRGFRRIGEGASRIAYLDKADNVVYKIGGTADNLIDVEQAKAFRSKPKGSLGFNLYIPRTRAVRGGINPYDFEHDYVAIQEFAAGGRSTHCNMFYDWMRHRRCTCFRPKGQCHAERLERIRDWSDLFDIHGQNVLWVPASDTYWLIDMAC